MAEEKRSVSLNPDDFIAGGLLDDFTAKLTHTFVMYDFEGKSFSGEKEPCLKLDMVDETTGEELQPQYMGAGKSADWVPSEDGKSLIPVSEKAALVKTSNLAIYFTEMINAGFPKNKLGSSVASLDGIVAHMVRKELPKRAGVTQTRKGSDGQEYAKTILVPDRIVTLPGEKAKGAKAASKETAPDDDAIQNAAINFVIELLTAKNGTFQKKDIPAASMKLDTKVRPKVLSLLISSDAFLAGGGGGLWTYENGTVKQAA